MKTLNIKIITAIKALILSVIVANSIYANARDEWTDTFVERIRIDRDGRGIAEFADALDIAPYDDTKVCTSNYYNKYWYSFDSRSDGGKAMLSALITAKSTKQQVRVYGRKGICETYTSVQDLRLIILMGD